LHIARDITTMMSVARLSPTHAKQEFYIYSRSIKHIKATCTGVRYPILEDQDSGKSSAPGYGCYPSRSLPFLYFQWDGGEAVALSPQAILKIKIDK